MNDRTTALAVEPRRASFGRGTRVSLAVLAPIGPLAMAAWAVSTPYNPGDDVDASIRALIADPTGGAWGLLWLLVAAVTGSAGALVVGSVVRRGSPLIGSLAAAMAFTGFIIAAYPGPVSAVVASRAAALESAQVAALVTAIDAQPAGVVAGIVFIALPAGVLLLGVAAIVAARRRAYPLAAALVLVLSIPLVLVGGFIADWALAIGWVVVAVGFGWAGAVFAKERESIMAP